MLTPFEELDAVLAVYTLHTAKVASKHGALEWARDNLDRRWRPLLTQVIQDRTLGWDLADPPRPGSFEATYQFAAYAAPFARRQDDRPPHRTRRGAGRWPDGTDDSGP